MQEPTTDDVAVVVAEKEQAKNTLEPNVPTEFVWGQGKHPNFESEEVRQSLEPCEGPRISFRVFQDKS